MSLEPGTVRGYRALRAETLTLTWSIVCLGGTTFERPAGPTP
jgi:hypothetical protein